LENHLEGGDILNLLNFLLSDSYSHYFINEEEVELIDNQVNIFDEIIDEFVTMLGVLEEFNILSDGSVSRVVSEHVRGVNALYNKLLMKVERTYPLSARKNLKKFINHAYTIARIITKNIPAVNVLVKHSAEPNNVKKIVYDEFPPYNLLIALRTGYWVAQIYRISNPRTEIEFGMNLFFSQATEEYWISTGVGIIELARRIVYYAIPGKFEFSPVDLFFFALPLFIHKGMPRPSQIISELLDRTASGYSKLMHRYGREPNPEVFSILREFNNIFVYRQAPITDLIVKGIDVVMKLPRFFYTIDQDVSDFVVYLDEALKKLKASAIRMYHINSSGVQYEFRISDVFWISAIRGAGYLLTPILPLLNTRHTRRSIILAIACSFDAFYYPVTKLLSISGLEP